MRSVVIESFLSPPSSSGETVPSVNVSLGCGRDSSAPARGGGGGGRGRRERERGTHEPDALGKQLHDLDRQVAHLAHEPHRVGAEPGAVGLGGPGRLLVARELEPHLERLFRVWVARRGPDLGVLRAGAERERGGEGRRGSVRACAGVTRETERGEQSRTFS